MTLKILGWCIAWIKSFAIVSQAIETETNCRHFAANILKCIFLNENVWNVLTISLKLVPKVQLNNIPSLVQIKAWCRSGDKPLSYSMMIWFTDGRSEWACWLKKCCLILNTSLVQLVSVWLWSMPLNSRHDGPLCDIRIHLALTCLSMKYTGPRLNIKTVLSAYGDFHVKDKTAVRTSYL